MLHGFYKLITVNHNSKALLICPHQKVCSLVNSLVWSRRVSHVTPKQTLWKGTLALIIVPTYMLHNGSPNAALAYSINPTYHHTLSMRLHLYTESVCHGYHTEILTSMQRTSAIKVTCETLRYIQHKPHKLKEQIAEEKNTLQNFTEIGC